MPSARNLFTRTGGGSIGRSMLVATMSAAAIATSVTGALFTDSDDIGANTFATGNVELSTNPTTNAISMSTMAPGDTKYGSITVTNGGSLALRYAVTSVTTEDTLAAQLDLTVWPESAETTVDSTCGTTVPAGTVYGPADLGSTTGAKIIGDAATGAQTGDRALAASTNELLCLKVALPSTTGNTYEGLTTTATFTFNSEQTANNA